MPNGSPLWTAMYTGSRSVNLQINAWRGQPSINLQFINALTILDLHTVIYLHLKIHCMKMELPCTHPHNLSREGVWARLYLQSQHPWSGKNLTLTTRMTLDECFLNKGKDDPVKVIWKSLSTVLVCYYPVAGWLMEDYNKNLAVDCNGQGCVVHRGWCWWQVPF